MTQLLDLAVAAARDLPADLQDYIARIVLELAGRPNKTIALTHDEHEALAGSKAAAARGDFATDEQVRAVWAKHGL